MIVILGMTKMGIVMVIAAVVDVVVLEGGTSL